MQHAIAGIVLRKYNPFSKMNNDYALPVTLFLLYLDQCHYSESSSVIPRKISLLFCYTTTNVITVRVFSVISRKNSLLFCYTTTNVITESFSGYAAVIPVTPFLYIFRSRKRQYTSKKLLQLLFSKCIIFRSLHNRCCNILHTQDSNRGIIIML